MSERSSLRYIFRKKGSRISLLLIITFLITAYITTVSGNRAVRAMGAILQVHPGSITYSTGKIVTVQGSNYAANEMVELYWNYTGPGTGQLELSLTTDGTGAFSTPLTPPIAPLGIYAIAGVGQTSGLVATTTLQVVTSVLLSTKAAGPGTTFTLYGKGFAAGETAKVYWNYTGPGILIATITCALNGSFETTAQVPANAAYGKTTVVGVGQTSGTSGSTEFVLYQPTLALAPLVGSAGSLITLSAYGFQSYEFVDIFWSKDRKPLATISVDKYGYLAPTPIKVPINTPRGVYQVALIGRTSQLSVTNTFTRAAPSSSLSITSGPVGTIVQVSGHGYAPREKVNILWNYRGSGTGTTLASATADLAGNVTTHFAAIADRLGHRTYRVAVVGVISKSITKNSFTLGNGLSANPAKGSPGQIITAAGTGFRAGESIQLYWDTISGTLLTTTTADANRNMNQTISFPSTALPGAHTLVAVGQTSQHVFVAQVTVDTDWGDFGFNHAHRRQNYYENSISPANAGNLQLKWTAPVGANSSGAPSPIYADGIVYIATLDGKLNAYDALTGALRWSYNSNTGYANLTSPVVDPETNTLFFGTLGYLENQDTGIPSPTYALDTQTGALKWSLIIPRDDYGFPTLAFSTIYLGAASEGAGGSLFAIDETTGRVIWQYATNGGVWGAVGVDIQTKTVFTGVGNPSNQVVALAAMSGTLLWQYSVSYYRLDDDIGTAIAVANGMVYIDSKNGNMYALSESSGTPIWSTPIGAHSNGDVSSPVVGSNGVVYVGSRNHQLYALDAMTGAIRWQTPTGGSIFSSPALANGVVYFASNDWKIYAVDAATGAVLWTYLTGDQTFSSPIIANGWLYCASRDGNLYAFSL